MPRRFGPFEFDPELGDLLHAKLVRAADGAIVWSVNREYEANALRAGSRAVAADIAGHVAGATQHTRLDLRRPPSKPDTDG